MPLILNNGKITNGNLVTFSPLVYSPMLWLDTNDLPTITKDGVDKVSQWDDKSGNNNNATQVTPARQPLLVLDSLNNKHVINYNRSNKNYMSTSYNWPLAFTIFVVIRPEIVHVNQRVISSYDGASAFANGEYLLYLFNDTVVFANFGVNISSAPILSINTPYLITVTCTGGSGGVTELFVNQISRGTGINSSTIANRPIVIGEDSPPPGNAQEYFQGDIPEIIVNSSLLTPKEIANNEQYLINKWTIF